MKPKNSNREKIIIVTIICTFILTGILGSYAFFQTNSEHINNEDITVNTGTLSLIFSDGNPGINESLEFSKSTIKTFTIKNNGTLDATVNINFDKLINTYTYGSLTYTLDYSESTDSNYKEVLIDRKIFTGEEQQTQVLAAGLKIPAKQTNYYKLTITLNYLEDIDQTSDLNAKLSTNFIISEGNENILNKIKDFSHQLNETPNFTLASTTNEGIYQMKDDYGTSYYYRGAVENNYVKFAGFYWRIIRINGDGTLRIIYDGTKPHANGEASIDRFAIKDIPFNEKSNDAKYIGYMYAPTGDSLSTSREEATSNIEDSNIKKHLEDWYILNIKNNNFDQFISDNIFCNDRDFASINTGTGFGTSITFYITKERIGVDGEANPTLSCKNKNDAFTKQNTLKGNGKLNEKEV